MNEIQILDNRLNELLEENKHKYISLLTEYPDSLVIPKNSKHLENLKRYLNPLRKKYFKSIILSIKNEKTNDIMIIEITLISSIKIDDIKTIEIKKFNPI